MIQLPRYTSRAVFKKLQGLRESRLLIVLPQLSHRVDSGRGVWWNSQVRPNYLILDPSDQSTSTSINVCGSLSQGFLCLALYVVSVTHLLRDPGLSVIPFQSRSGS